MKREEVLERFCVLATEVNDVHFGFDVSADCFCGVAETKNDSNFQFSSQVMEFIERAVRKELKQHSSL